MNRLRELRGTPADHQEKHMRNTCETLVSTPMRHSFVTHATTLRHASDTIVTILQKTCQTPAKTCDTLRHNCETLDTISILASHLRHLYDTFATPLRHLVEHFATTQRHTCDLPVARLRQPFDTLRHTCVTFATPCDTFSTLLRQPYGKLATPSRHIFDTIATHFLTHLRITFDTLATHLRHFCGTFSTHF